MQIKKPDEQRRTCAVCNARLQGRSDKIYCDIKCKNRYHGQKRKEIRNVYEVYGRIAYNNAEILASLMNEGNDHLEISQLELQRLGFNFQHVSSWDYRHGIYTFKIFNYSWSFGGKNRVIISRDQPLTDISPFMFRRWNTRYPYDEYRNRHFESLMPAIRKELSKSGKNDQRFS